MIITLTPTHIACLSLGLSCEWGTFLVDSSIREEWVNAVGRQRLVVNCEQRMIRYRTWRWHAISCRLISADPVVIYPFLDWVRSHRFYVREWLIDGKDPFRYSRRWRWVVTALVLMSGVAWVLYHRLNPPPRPSTGGMVRPLQLKALYALCDAVTQQAGVIVSMGSTPEQAHLTAVMPSHASLSSFQRVEETPLNEEWKGVKWRMRDD